MTIEGGLARFAARYRVATTLTGMHFSGLAQDSELGYTAAFRCGLAYSALEALDRALGARGRVTPIVSPQVASALRSTRAEKLMALLAAELDDSRLVDRIAAMPEGRETADVAPLAAGIRHVVFHGGFTSHGSGAARSASVRSLLEKLSEATLGAADARFERYLDDQALGPWEVDVLDECPSCSIRIGQAHGRSCDVARCGAHGEQLIACEASGRHRPAIWRGVYPGTVEALKRGWMVERRGREHPDINRVLVELTWDTTTETFVRPRA
jgi:hypothetical protein